MVDTDLKPLFEGANESRLLSELFHRMRWRTRNEPQAIFHAAWDATEILNGDGFEMLLEQGKPLDGYADALVKVGMPQVKPIFDRVTALIPPSLLSPENESELFPFLRSRFDELKSLLYEFFDATKDIVPVVSNYVRRHREDFAEYSSAE